jgi:putative component of membrane protein insertase Oxa1/YidC/SpoIIIJ protein YidD
MICSKRIIIEFVRLYQHYAPEEVRRTCLLMPTCSEYKILAVQKYGALPGLCKGIYRLLITCRGTVYRIDYP